MKIISKTEFYKEAEDLHDLCEELMTNNQENELTKYSKLKKKEFMPLCVWLNLRADNKEVFLFFDSVSKQLCYKS